MLKSYQQQNGGLKGTEVLEGAPIAPESLWIDLLEPSVAERAAVNALLGMELPTRADMEEIEVSSRLYVEDGGVFMTALVLSNAESERPVADVVTFVLARDKLITIRYIDPQPFRSFAARCERSMVSAPKAEGVLNALLDVIVDRMADVLERVGADVEAISREIFDAGDAHLGRRDFQGVLRRLGAKHDLTGKMRECLLTLSRMTTFLSTAIDSKATKEARAHVKTLTRDAQSLLDHSSFIASKLSYLQDATLGPHQQRAEQHHQDHVGGGDGVPAAHPHRLDLRHELPHPARARMAVRLSLFPGADGGLGGRALHLVQAARLAVGTPGKRSARGSRAARHGPPSQKARSFRV